MTGNRFTIWVASCAAILALPMGVGAQQGAPAATAAASAATDVCVPTGIVEDLGQCPAGAKQARMDKIRGGQPKSRMRQAQRDTPTAKQKLQVGPGFELSEAERRGKEKATQQRAWELLQREVTVLKRLVSNTRKDDARRPDILLRLAETFFEMQQTLTARVRSFDEPIFQACQQQKDAERCKAHRQNQKNAEKALADARQEGIRTYAMLVSDHPDFRRMDEVLFALAFGLEQMRQMPKARQVYHRLIKDYPQSRFIPHAYLSFAEFFFNEGEMTPALQFYTKVTEFPPNRNPVYGYALYKQGWAFYNVEDFRKSLQKFVEVIEFATQNPDATDVKNLARQARREMILPYAMVGSPGKALAFFRRYATDAEQALEMFEHLAELYYDTGQWQSTIAVYHELMSQNSNSDKLCYWQGRVTNAIISSKGKPDQVREIRRLVDMYETYIKQERPADRKKQCKQEAATILVSLSTAWHREAVGTDTQPGTGDNQTMDLASALYRVLIQKFPDMEQMEFPDIDKRDWPTRYRIAYFYAELLWKREDWEKCGPAFDQVVELNPRGEYTQDAAYAAVLCYNNLYQQQYQGRETEVRGEARTAKGRKQAPKKAAVEAEFAKREFTELERGMLGAFHRYVCFISDSSELPTIKYRRARIYYEANRFEEASLLFKDIALNHSDTELGVFAANLYLDSLNVLATKAEPKKPQCIDEMQKVLDPFGKLYCKTAALAEENSELCDPIRTLECQLIRKKAEGYQENQQFKKAASEYIGIFREHQRCAELEEVRMDEVLYNAALNLEAAKLLGAAIQVRGVLIQRFPESHLAKRSIYLLGANWHAIAMYDRAAEYYEQFARKYPGEDGSKCSEADKKNKLCPIAHEALMNAVFFRLGLGQAEEARNDVRLFEKNFGKKLPRETSQVVFAQGSVYERANNWNGVIDHYRLFLRKYQRTALPHQLVMANIQIARAYWKKDDKDTARRTYGEVIKLWQRGLPQQIDRADGEQAEKIGWMREAVDGTAEALFHVAEVPFYEFRRIKFPEYKGGKSLERVNKWSQASFAPWVQQKLQALRKAEAEFNKVAVLKVKVTDGLELQSAPWQIAAAARIGEMYRSFVDDFRDAPVPDEIRKDPELFDIYVGALDTQSEPLLKQAMEKFEFCLRTATNVRWFNEWSRKCEQELADLDPRQYPVAAELRGEPNYVYQTVAPPGPADLPTEEDDAVQLGSGAAAAGGDS
jgi:tetratricopeptide (TPR) repeat protein